MNKIHQNKIKMRPKVYFIIGSLLTFIGVVFSLFTSVFLVSLIRFSLRSHGPMKAYRLEQLISNFPWWTVIFAIAGLFIGIELLRRYDFSYKINFKFIVVGVFFAIVIAGWLIDMTGLNNTLMHRGHMQGIYRPHLRINSFESTENVKHQNYRQNR